MTAAIGYSTALTVWRTEHSRPAAAFKDRMQSTQSAQTLGAHGSILLARAA
jgi:hypothetical protein